MPQAYRRAGTRPSASSARSGRSVKIPLTPSCCSSRMRASSLTVKTAVSSPSRCAVRSPRFVTRRPLEADENRIVVEAVERSLDCVAAWALQLDHHADPAAADLEHLV